MRLNMRGFTLLEVLLVVAAIGILAAIVIVAINPSKQLADTKNAQRKVDVNTILNGVYQHALDNGGVVTSTITTTSKEICRTGAASCTSLVSLLDLTLNGKYLVSIPVDPISTSTNGTGYFIARDANNRITVNAPLAENGLTISATR